MLREDFEPIDGWLRVEIEYILEIFELVFGAADLLDPHEIAKKYQLHREQLSRETENTETTPLTPDELPRQAACGELQRSHFVLIRAQAKFDNRDGNYDGQLAEFKELEVAGKLDHTRTDFDFRELQHMQQLTRDLICAEEDYKNASVQANVHKVPFPERPETELSVGADRDDDGYQESQEVWVIAEVDGGRIERWVSRVPDTQDEPSPEDRELKPTDLDEWNARLPIDLFDSVSMFDTIGYAAKIGNWQRHCIGLRQCSKILPVEDLWAPHEQGISTRHSC